jgi:hypothetical protein
MRTPTSMSNMSNPRKNIRFPFVPTHEAIEEILADHALAALGDAYTNLIYSLYLSITKGKATGVKANSNLLSEALKQAGLREFLPSRIDRHRQADAAEALLVYVWLQGLTTLTESVFMLARHKDATKAFCALLSEVKKKLEL